MTARRVLRAPFPWFGGKFNAAPLIWRAFGNVPNYVEPFAGSLATLLARPHEPKVETVNDKDGLIANFWRAVQHAPEAVAEYSDWPVNEADLHARHRWLVEQALPLTEKLIADPDWFDAKVAGWWVWGICAWIGGGWCHPDVRLQRRRPELANANGRGVNHPDRRRPHLSGSGMGVLKLHRNLPHVSKPGIGVHAPGMKKPLTHRNKGVHRDGAPPDLFEQLAERLRDVRVCCGDWTRVVGRSTLGIDTRHGMTPCAVLLDPPYAHELRDKRMYREDDEGLSAAVRAWAIENGSNPDLRIALCGFVDEHEMPAGWKCHEWRSTSSGKNRAKERIWFSPYCLDVDARQGSLALEQLA